jgi:hypothetical protein
LWENYGSCVARIELLNGKLYSNTVDFVLGLPWFLKYCHTFDYEQLRIGLSEVINDIDAK